MWETRPLPSSKTSSVSYFPGSPAGCKKTKMRTVSMYCPSPLPVTTSSIQHAEDVRIPSVFLLHKAWRFSKRLLPKSRSELANPQEMNVLSFSFSLFLHSSRDTSRLCSLECLCVQCVVPTLPFPSHAWAETSCQRLWRHAGMMSGGQLVRGVMCTGT